MSTKKTSVRLDEHNLEIAKNHGVNVSKLCNDALAICVNMISGGMPKSEYYEELCDIERQEIELKTRKELVKLSFMNWFNEIEEELPKSCEAYEEMVETGVYNRFKFKILKEATGFYEPQLEDLAYYCERYEYDHPERDDKYMFKESLDYLIRRYNEDNPERKLMRQGGYL